MKVAVELHSPISLKNWTLHLEFPDLKADEAAMFFDEGSHQNEYPLKHPMIVDRVIVRAENE